MTLTPESEALHRKLSTLTLSAPTDRMLWGGIGTLMEVEIEECMAKHTSEVRALKTTIPAVLP